MKIIDKYKAADQGKDFFFTGKPCKYGHTSKRYIVSGMCVECAKERSKRKALGGKRTLVWDKTKGKCWYCGLGVATDKRKFHVDHFIAHRHGGTADLSNLVPSCHKCNMSKCNKSIEEYRETIQWKSAGRPHFSPDQKKYLVSIGVEFPKTDTHTFWFEKKGLSI